VAAASATFVTIFRPVHRPLAARQRDGVAAEVEDLLHRAGPQRREHERGEHRLRRARHRGRLAARVVADEGDRAARARRAAEVRVADGVRRAVQAGVLAVPPAHDAVHAGVRERVGQLRAPDGGGAELLVDRGLEVDLVGLAELAVALELLVQAAERRALVAREEVGDVQPGAGVGPVLVGGQAYERLDAREEDPAVLEQVLVVQRDRRRRRHGLSSLRREW
jgi:hypothetical protein